MRHLAFVLVMATALASTIGGCAGHAEHRHAGHHGYHEHPFERMPADVRAAVKRDYPAAQVVSAGTEFSDKDEIAHYHIKLRAPDGKMMDAEYDQSGRKMVD